MTGITLLLHWLLKSPCRDGQWHDLKQYRMFCYTDVMALYYADGIADGKIPYRDYPVEYPVLIGGLMAFNGMLAELHASLSERVEAILRAQFRARLMEDPPVQHRARVVLRRTDRLRRSLDACRRKVDAVVKTPDELDPF